MSLVRIQKKQEAPATGKYVSVGGRSWTSAIYVPKVGPVYIGLFINKYWPSDVHDFFGDDSYLTNVEECPASEVPLTDAYIDGYSLKSNDYRWLKATASRAGIYYFINGYQTFAFICIA